jgi:hypothetical protein
VPENLQPPRAASRILAYLGSPHLPQILGDLMEEFHERVQSTGLSAARRWYWRATLRNMIALAARGEMTGKARPRTLFLICGIWFSIAVLWMWLSHGWLTGLEHQAWGVMTAVVFLLYFLLEIGWSVPLLWALIRLVSPSLTQGKHLR